MLKPGKVYIKRVADKQYLQLAWLDPDTGKERRRSAKTNRARDADKLAEALEKTLYRGVPVDGISWFDFDARYRSEYLATLKKKSRSDWPTVHKSITAIIDPQSLRDVTPSAISDWAAKLSKRGKPRGRITKYLTTLRAALRWAENLRLIHEAPYVSIPTRGRKKTRTMKGRPITLEEFERMIKAVPKCVSKMLGKSPTIEEKHTLIESWRFALWGYWYSGMRLEEATQLYWDRPDKLCIQGIDTKHPMMLIQEELEKGNEDRLYPLTPDFVDFLRKVPPRQRNGRVLRPRTSRGVTESDVTIGRTISAIGREARVVVNTAPRKYASAHDLRRSFGTRWAPLVQPVILQQLMRHKSLSTSMDFYVKIRASETSDILRRALVARESDLSGDPRPRKRESVDRF